LCGAEISTIRQIDQKYLEMFEKISWTHRVRNEDVLLGVNEDTKHPTLNVQRLIGLTVSCVGTAF
jgi:hypothetical protein